MSGEAYWWLALGLGLVVAVVAVGLLQVFLSQVHRIERGAEAVWQAGKEVAANTASTWLLPEVGTRLDALAEEAGRHRELLRPGPGTGGRSPDGRWPAAQAVTEDSR